jgi:hypothetical protein
MDEIIQKSAATFGIDARVLKLIVDSEAKRSGHKGKGYDAMFYKPDDQGRGQHSYGVCQIGERAWREIKDKMPIELKPDWDLAKGGDAQSQVDACAGYVKYYIQPRLNENGLDPKNPIRIAMIFKGAGTLRDGKIIYSEKSKKMKLLRTLGSLWDKIKGLPKPVQAN